MGTEHWLKPPLPKKTCNANALEKRFLEMAEETVTKRGKGDMEGGFTFAPDVYVNEVDNGSIQFNARGMNVK